MSKRFLTQLTEEDQVLLGVSRPAPFAFADKVRFAELDPLNHVNNVAYQIWFETARVQYFTAWGLSNYRHDGTEPLLVIRRGETDYLKEMKQGEEYVVTCRTIAYRKTSFTIQNEIWSNGRCCTVYHGVVVLLDPATNEKMPLPDEFKKKITKIDGARFTPSQ